jgi:hypothetical protein
VKCKLTAYSWSLLQAQIGVTPAQVTEWITLAKAMVGKIPGLLKLEANTPLAATAHRNQGYEVGLISVMEKKGDLRAYAEHPVHLK